MKRNFRLQTAEGRLSFGRRSYWLLSNVHKESENSDGGKNRFDKVPEAAQEALGG
jgi:hypothetical protein